MSQKIDHIGMVVKNTEEMITLFSNLFGFEVTESIAFPEQGFKSTLISKEEVTIELIEPMGTEGIIQKFVQKQGWGLHHLSIRVDDIESEMKLLKIKGVKLVNDEPQVVKGTSNKSAFIHPHSTKGLLIELVRRSNSDRG
ncbi:MAG: methylmalonyl-CoA epimerase [Thermodesulfobacteriota bacterium]|jgi:methylmalonyl-CoA epimerase